MEFACLEVLVEGHVPKKTKKAKTSARLRPPLEPGGTNKRVPLRSFRNPHCTTRPSETPFQRGDSNLAPNLSECLWPRTTRLGLGRESGMAQVSQPRARIRQGTSDPKSNRKLAGHQGNLQEMPMYNTSTMEYIQELEMKS